ncbi:hypothetical protein C0J52_28396 [Blattella germanica]|nr:hypothetical protein C0J52_28396 [Blattella germanica]
MKPTFKSRTVTFDYSLTWQAKLMALLPKLTDNVPVNIIKELFERKNNSQVK